MIILIGGISLFIGFISGFWFHESLVRPILDAHKREAQYKMAAQLADLQRFKEGKPNGLLEGLIQTFPYQEKKP